MPQSPDRPDLEKQSVVFSAVGGVGWGAVAGAAMAAVAHGIEKLGKRIPERTLLEKVSGNAVGVGLTVGLIDGFATYYVNQQKQQTKPYVERLEQEIAAKSIADSSPQK